MAISKSNPAAWRADRARKSDRSGRLIGSEIIQTAGHFQQKFVAPLAAIDPAALAALAFLLLEEART